VSQEEEQLVSHDEVEQRVRRAGLVPVVALPAPSLAVPLARALLRGGLDVIEITFRTAGAAAAIGDIRRDLPEMLVGAGTITAPEQATAAAAAGAQFGVAPGFNGSVLATAREAGLPFWPGVATPTDIETALTAGCRLLKYFPAEAMGGATTIKALLGPYRHLGVEFIPTGGINADRAPSYWRVPGIAAIGGSWIAPKQLLVDEAWVEIEELTRVAVAARAEALVGTA
jgi:2-dehydro-3-deoxyphosphogluconate aldolase/(4S)-4-hydroxy-2-oxoglutarate aldolase